MYQTSMTSKRVGKICVTRLILRLITWSRYNQRVSADMNEPPEASNPTHAKRRQYYMSWRRAELVDELLRVQQERDDFQEQWLDVSDNLLQWQLRALEAEKHLEAKQLTMKSRTQE
jgi:hypothetical protein